MSAYAGALEAVDRILNRGGDADDVLREVLEVLRTRAGFRWAGIAFAESGELRLGPQVGERPVGEETSAYPVVFGGERVAELQVAPAVADDAGRALLERVALLVSPHCLVGWDTGGEPWIP